MGLRGEIGEERKDGGSGEVDFEVAAEERGVGQRKVAAMGDGK